MPLHILQQFISWCSYPYSVPFNSISYACPAKFVLLFWSLNLLAGSLSDYLDENFVV